MKKIFTLALLIISITGFAQTTLQFGSLDSLFLYAEKNSAAIKINSEQSLMAKWTKVAALANTVNLRSPLNFTMTDNTKLPVNFIPGEIFGGPPGSLRQITLGQQYISNLGLTPQIDIINPAAWAKVKSADFNKQLTEINNLITKKNLYESIAACYYNIVSMQEQIVVTQQNSNSADSLLLIIQNKYNAGIVREQDLNNATINQLSINDKLFQLKESLQQQLNSLKILCDIDPATIINLSEKITNTTGTFDQVLTANSSLQEKYTLTQSQFSKAELSSNRLYFAPTVSLIFNQSWQQNSNDKFFDNSNWIASQYIGVKFTLPFPFDATKLSQSYTSKINLKIAKINLEHNALQNKLNNQQLSIDYSKAYSTYNTSQKIAQLKASNFQKSKNQYASEILSTENLLTSFTDKLTADLNQIVAAANLKYIQSKININNSIK